MDGSIKHLKRKEEIVLFSDGFKVCVCVCVCVCVQVLIKKGSEPNPEGNSTAIIFIHFKV